MGMFLNSKIPYDAYRVAASGQYFVDKSSLLNELIPALGTDERFYCITRPRRFGKSVMANMVAAFFGKAANASDLFHRLQVAECHNYRKHLNQHDVIYLDLSGAPENCTSYQSYITRILQGLKADLHTAYPDLHLDPDKPVWDLLDIIFQDTGDKFIFIIDEWDALFHMPFPSEQDKSSYLLFLKSLLKGKVYAEFVYMTGVLPIAKYSSGSELNMFMEFGMTASERFSGYFGFSDSEVDMLYEWYLKLTCHPKITREDLRDWYDGYHTAAACRLYNPRSVVYALINNQLRNYWTSSGPYDEIFYYIRNNVQDIRDDLALMISGKGIEANVEEYAATAPELNTKDQIYSAMVVYGLLTYEDVTGEVSIPNKELMSQFEQMLLTNESLGYVHRLACESVRMVKATLAGDTKTMGEILQYAHNTESPIFSYNSEIELSAVVNLVYLSARDKYRVEREDRAGKGYVDFIFYPERRGTDAIILELKIDRDPEEAIRQIKEKGYVQRLKGKLGESPKYTGRILIVGISYSRKSKEHRCKVEVLE